MFSLLTLIVALIFHIIFLLAYSQNSNTVIIQLMNNWLTFLVVLLTYLILLRFLVLYLILEELKYIFSILSVVLVRLPNKLNNFLFQCYLYFYVNPIHFNINIAKINIAITYFFKVVQNWFEVGFN